MARSLFASTEESPYHLSVGAVLYNGKGEIACHYFKELRIPQDTREYTDFRILMRETVEEKESLEAAVLRGIHEEFGATGDIKRFIGTLVTSFPRGDVPVEKTTVYFLIELKEFNPSERDFYDEERTSLIEWQPIDWLISEMEEQGKKIERTDLDESTMLRRAKSYLRG